MAVYQSFNIKRQLGKSKTVRWLYFKFLFVFHVFLDNLLHWERLFLFLRVLPYTMVGYPRIKNVYETAQEAVKKGISGAFVECGVWKGGAAGVLGFVAQKENRGRQLWLFDSFEGLPEPTAADGSLAQSYAGGKTAGNLVSIGQCVGLLEDVRRLFLSVLKLRGEDVHIEKGWFQDTLPGAKARIGLIAVLRLDADWYESTKVALEQLYDNVVLGGYVIIDDYGHWEGCRKAVHEFLDKRNIKVDIKQIDYTGVYFEKP